MSAKRLGEILPQALENLKELKPQSSKDLALTLKDDVKGKQELGVLLSQFFDTMKLYGKEPEQLKSTAALFNFALADYPAENIRQAFAYHLQISTEMPTPADIVNIMRRGNKPPLDRSVYIRLSKKDPQDRDRADWAYINEYEEFMIHG